jgi:hypothetical protein
MRLLGGRFGVPRTVSRWPGYRRSAFARLFKAASEAADTPCRLAIDDSVSPRLTTCVRAAASADGASASVVVINMPTAIRSCLTLSSVVSGFLAEELKMPFVLAGSTKREGDDDAARPLHACPAPLTI